MREDTIAAFECYLVGTLGFTEGERSRAGKVVISTSVCAAIFGILACIVLFDTNVPKVRADDVSTSVTVLNTAPSWTVDAEETVESSTSTPTNSGSIITWHATGTDSSGDNYYLLICKTSGQPAANAGSAPSCNGGVSNQWAVSSSITSGTRATAATTTKETFPFENEKNDWWAWICDNNGTLPKCNTTPTQGNGDAGKASPFVVNHPPVFSALSNDSPLNPGETISWTTTSYDNDTLDTNDQVRILVCKAQDYANGACGAGGTWATSTLTASNAATTTTITIPYPDGSYAAYVYIVDTHNHQATSTFNATNSPFVVNNIAPTTTPASISLEDIDTTPGDRLVLITPNGTSGPFRVEFDVSDDNSCVNITSGNEIASAEANIYRSGIGSSLCDEASEYDSRYCYVNLSPYFSNHISCTQDAGTCSGVTDSVARWTCSFNFWFNADPTYEANTQYNSENWLASVRISDDDFATSTLINSSSGNELESFLAFDVSSTSIPYGSLEPGSQSPTLATSTDMRAIGNTGLDEDLYGDTMCPTWTTADSCDNNGFQAGNDILIANQKFATSVVAYGSAQAYAMTGSTTPSELLIRIPKTIATTSVQVKYTYWGIAIPGAITTSGSYTGQNTITAKASPAAFW